MKTLPLLLLGLVLAALVLPASAPARVIEVGTAFTELPPPSCPSNPCFAVSRTTGYQAKVGDQRGLFQVPADGRIVAWTIRLAQPNPTQLDFFRSRLGGDPQAGISVLRTGARLFGRVVAASPVQTLTPYLGQTVQFPLERSIPVRRGSTIALTVPTWAPALSIGLGSDTSWRASRPRGQCDDTETQTAQTTIRALTQYRCLYQRVRLSYSATLITNPEPTAPASDGETSQRTGR